MLALWKLSDFCLELINSVYRAPSKLLITTSQFTQCNTDIFSADNRFTYRYISYRGINLRTVNCYNSNFATNNLLNSSLV